MLPAIILTVKRTLLVLSLAFITFVLSLAGYLILELLIEYQDGVVKETFLAFFPIMVYVLVMLVHLKTRKTQTAHEVDWQIICCFIIISALWMLAFFIVGLPVFIVRITAANVIHALLLLLLLGFPFVYPSIIYLKYIRKGKLKTRAKSR